MQNKTVKGYVVKTVNFIIKTLFLKFKDHFCNVLLCEDLDCWE